MTRDELTPTMVIDRITEYKGNIAAVARSLKMSRQTLYKYIKDKATIKAAIDDSRETMLDHVESALYSAALNGEAWAVCFFLKTQGKGRGYVERQEITGARGGPVELEWFDGSKVE